MILKGSQFKKGRKAHKTTQAKILATGWKSFDTVRTMLLNLFSFFLLTHSFIKIQFIIFKVCRSNRCWSRRHHLDAMIHKRKWIATSNDNPICTTNFLHQPGQFCLGRHFKLCALHKNYARTVIKKQYNKVIILLLFVL